MLDDLNELRTFRAILAEGSLSAAARRYAGGSQQAARGARGTRRRSAHNGTTRALSATEEGSRLLMDVERALEAIEAGEVRLATNRPAP